MLDINKLFQITLTTSLSFLIILILARLLGKKQMSQLTFFNYITGITIGSIAANIVTMEGADFWFEAYGLFWWCVLTYLIDIIGLKIPKLRVILDGQPTILIKKREIQYKALKKMRIDLDNLTMMLREQGVFSITEVEYAILEPNGELTVLKKAQFQSPNKKDMLVKTEPIKYLPQEIIVDGKVLYKNLKENGLDKDWLDKKIKDRNVKDIKLVKYAELQEDGKLYIDI